jgi:hypothetical protein
MSTTETVDGTAVDLAPEAPQSVETLPARRERRSEVIRPLGAQALADSFTEYQELLPKLLTSDDYQNAGGGKSFVKKSGWRKIATAFDLDVQIIASSVERAPDGTPLRAEVIARAIAPSGRSMDGDGYCSIDEDRFSGPRGNKSKLENDLRATATTRAKNRAIADLVGMGAVSAEEVSAGPAAAPLPDWAQPANGEQLTDAIRGVLNALGIVADDQEAAGAQIWAALSAAAGGGDRPRYAVDVLNTLTAAVTSRQPVTA